MSMIHALSEPVLPVLDPNASAVPGIAAVRVLPCPGIPSSHLAINLMRTDPGWATTTHHHGELDTTLYVVRGTMAFHCGPGLRESVAARAGELASIDPHAVHAEYNPDADEASLGITARDTPGMFIVPSAPAEQTARTGITVVPPASSSSATTIDFMPYGSHHLRVRRLALDRLTLSPGAHFTAPASAADETAICVLDGSARITGGAADKALDGHSGAWWYVEPGAHWSLSNQAATAAAELLVIRSRIA